MVNNKTLGIILILIAVLMYGAGSELFDGITDVITPSGNTVTCNGVIDKNDIKSVSCQELTTTCSAFFGSDEDVNPDDVGFTQQIVDLQLQYDGKRKASQEFIVSDFGNDANFAETYCLPEDRKNFYLRLYDEDNNLEDSFEVVLS